MVEKRDLTDLVDMESIAAQQEGDPIQLCQFAGPGAERVFRILPLQRAIIGRGEAAIIQIEEKGVSRRHALVEHQDGIPRLVDLGSTNGTFVNAQRIDTYDLRTGDQVQVGSAIFKVAVGRDDEEKPAKQGTDPQLREQIAQIHEQLKGQASGSGQLVVQETILAGVLENIGLPSLLQTLEANQNSGSVLIHLEEGQGHIYLQKGRPTHAKLGRTRGKKALFRLMDISKGRFEFVKPGFEPDNPTIEAQLEAIMLAAVTENDEFREYRKELPPSEAALTFAPNRTFILDRMPPDLFEVLAAICRHQTVGAVIDECSLSDLMVCRNLLMLLNEKIIEVAS
ncbi:MAG: FHA domain-containing protein, partial [bacterium]|nr:FHA domain-containing protein [bacterium]